MILKFSKLENMKIIMNSKTKSKKTKSKMTKTKMTKSKKTKMSKKVREPFQ